MTYPVSMYPNPVSPFHETENPMMKDLEYLQEMYPQDAKRYQKRIRDILDKLDYEGSMIYDEYPDKWMLRKMSGDILDMIKNEEECVNPECPIVPEKWEWMKEMIEILLYYEVYHKRHCEKRGNLFRF